jgi:hypothetical protein
MITDQNGFIHLGELRECCSIKVIGEDIFDEFKIDNSNKLGHLPENVIGLEGEKLII